MSGPNDPTQGQPTGDGQAPPATPTPAEGAAPAATPGDGGTSSPTPTAPAVSFSQTDVDSIASKAREEARARTLKDLGFESIDAAKAAIKAAEEAEEAKLGDVEKLNKQLTKRDERIAELEAMLLDRTKEDVLKAKGLDPALKDRLRGTTLEELQADADVLAGLVPTTPAPTSVGAPTAPAAGNTAGSLEEQIAEAEKAHDWPLAMRLKTQLAQQAPVT